MAAMESEQSPFSFIWNNALADYFAKLPPNCKYDLRDAKWLEIRNVDDLTRSLAQDHADFNKDTVSTNAFSKVLKTALGPLELVMGMCGGAATMAFPPSSQILGAVSILIGAGKAVTGAFDALRGLFEKIGFFLSRLQGLTGGRERVPRALEDILRAILVSILDICALATRRSFHVAGESKHSKLRDAWRKTKSNVAEFSKQLILGADSEVDGSVAKLEQLVDAETKLTVALTKRDTADIKSVAVEIQGTTITLTSVTWQIQKDTAELKLKVDLIREDTRQTKEDTTIIREDAKQTKEDATEIKSNVKKMMEMQDSSNRVLEGILRLAGQSASVETAQIVKAGEGRTKLSPIQQLQIRLTPATQVNDNVYHKTRQRFEYTTDWIIEEPLVKQWLEGKSPLLVISGSSGIGKTFLAGRIVDELRDRYKQAVQHASRTSVAYFFPNALQTGLDHMNSLIRTMAYQLAANDDLYCKKLLGKFKAGLVEKNSSEADRPFEINVRTIENDTQINGIAEDVAQVHLDDETGIDVMESGVEIGEEDGEHHGPENAPRVDGANDLSSDGTAMAKIDETLPDESIAVFNLWNAVFTDIYESSRASAFLVVDAVGELDRDEVPGLMRALKVSSKTPLDGETCSLSTLLFIDSDCSERNLNRLPVGTPHLVVGRSKTADDMGRFVERQTSDAFKNRLVDPVLVQELRSTVYEACEGNFTWASLLVDELTSFSREDRIRQMLSTLPRSLEEAVLLQLRRLHRQLDHDELEDLHDILAWVHCGKTNLSITQLDAILTIRNPQGARVTDLEKRLRDTYGTLFTIMGSDPGDPASRKERLERRLAVGDLALLKAPDEAESQPAAQSGRDSLGVLTIEPTVADRLTQLKDLKLALGHDMIGEALEERAADDTTLHISINSLRTTVLLGCVTALCDWSLHSESITDTANSHCALFLPDYLADISVEDTEVSVRIEIAHRLIRVLREETIIDRWIKFAGDWMTRDLLQNDAFCDNVLDWLQDKEVQQALSDPEAAWLLNIRAGAPIVLLEQVALRNASRWLLSQPEFSEPGNFSDSMAFGESGKSFEFVNCYLAKVNLPSRTLSGPLLTSGKDKEPRAVDDEHEEAAPSQVRGEEILEPAQAVEEIKQDIPSDEHANSVDNAPASDSESDDDAASSAEETEPDNTDYTLANAEKATILRVASWSNLEKNAAWYAGVSRAFASVGIWDEALEYVRKAIEFDSDGGWQWGLAGIVVSQKKDYGRAIDLMKEAITSYTTEAMGEAVAEAPDYTYRLRRLRAMRDLAKWYADENRIDESIEMYFEIAADWERADLSLLEVKQDAVLACYTVLCSNKRWAQAFDILIRITSHPGRATKEFWSVYEYVLYVKQQDLWKIYRHLPKLEVVFKLLTSAFEIAARFGQAGLTSHVRMHAVAACMNLSIDREDDAIRLCKAVIADEEVLDTANGSYSLKILAEEKLSMMYLTRILQARADDSWEVVGKYASELIALVKSTVQDDSEQNLISSGDCAFALAAWHGTHGQPERAREIARHHAQAGIDMLMDRDPDNDDAAWTSLGRALISVDRMRAVACINMARQLNLFGNKDTETSITDAMGASVEVKDAQASSQHGALSNEQNVQSEEATHSEIAVISAQTITEEDNTQTPTRKLDVPSLSTDEPASLCDKPAPREIEMASVITIEKSSHYSCDGLCLEPISDGETLWKCGICNLDLCQPFHELVLAKQTGNWKICSDLHERTECTGVTAAYTPGKLLVGSEEVEIERFLDEVKAEWGLR